MTINTIQANQLVPDMVGDTVSLYTANNKRVTGVLTAYCRHATNYTVEINGTRHWGVSRSAEIDLHTRVEGVSA